jgi:hypothetical protein
VPRFPPGGKWGASPFSLVLVLRFVVLFAGLFLLGMGVAYVVTRERKYLRLAWRVLQVSLLVGVAFALLYVFERVLFL